MKPEVLPERLRPGYAAAVLLVVTFAAGLVGWWIYDRARIPSKSEIILECNAALEAEIYRFN